MLRGQSRIQADRFLGKTSVICRPTYRLVKLKTFPTSDKLDGIAASTVRVGVAPIVLTTLIFMDGESRGVVAFVQGTSGSLVLSIRRSECGSGLFGQIDQIKPV